MMDASFKANNHEQEKRNQDPANYHASDVSSNWQMNGNNNFPNIIQTGNCMVESSACSTTFMPDSFCPPIWDHPINRHSLGYCDGSMQNQASIPSGIGPVPPVIDWTQSTMLKGSTFLPAVPGTVPPRLPHFPTDSAFIERAARFSCFGGGNFSEMMKPFSNPDHLNPYSRGFGQIPWLNDGMDKIKLPEQALVRGKHAIEGSVLMNENRSESLRRSYGEAKHGVNVSGTVSDDAEFSGRGVQEELACPVEDSCCAGLGSKKRKRIRQDTEYNESVGAQLPPIEPAKDHSETKLKGDDNPTSTSKLDGESGKHGSQGSDCKEEYIHVRARRGQATNSHSLAERVRREKISERMKFLQDLVPGCSKVTGKAVMLDEIINYVQSLQRQVEFLSMKLATVNPRLDFNVEALLAKDILQPRAGLSPSPAFPVDMTMPFLPQHFSQTGPIQVPSVWDAELHNIIRMGFNTSAPPNSQDCRGSVATGHLKTEP